VMFERLGRFDQHGAVGDRRRGDRVRGHRQACSAAPVAKSLQVVGQDPSSESNAGGRPAP